MRNLFFFRTTSVWYPSRENGFFEGKVSFMGSELKEATNVLTSFNLMPVNRFALSLGKCYEEIDVGLPVSLVLANQRIFDLRSYQ